MTESKCLSESPSSYFLEILFLADAIESVLSLDVFLMGMHDIAEAEEGLTFLIFSFTCSSGLSTNCWLI